MTRAQFVVLIGSKSYYQCRSYEELHVSGDLPLPTERGQAPEVFCWSGFGRGCVKLNKFPGGGNNIVMYNGGTKLT